MSQPFLHKLPVITKYPTVTIKMSLTTVFSHQKPLKTLKH